MAEEIQQVQTPIDTTQETTLETIEAIGTSSRKIIIGRQTRQKIYGESGATLTFTAPTRTYQPEGFYSDLEGTGTVSNEVGELSYNQYGNGIRLPLQSSYSLTITPAKGRSTGYGSVTTTTRVRVGGETIYSYNSTSSADYSETINITAGKFAVITIEIDMYLPATGSTGGTATVIVQKL